jgi:hypothetical protein
MVWYTAIVTSRQSVKDVQSPLCASIRFLLTSYLPLDLYVGDGRR